MAFSEKKNTIPKTNSYSSDVQNAGKHPQSASHPENMSLPHIIGNNAFCRLTGIEGAKNYTPNPSLKETLLRRFEPNRANDNLQAEEQSIQMKKENKTGLPDNLKAGVEKLSGLSLNDVRVHYNSNKPSEVGALAYTQGTDIHVTTGQEKHLPHEVWHVVQQAQGRAHPTIQMKGIAVDNDMGLEKEADEMGNKMLLQTSTEGHDKFLPEENSQIQPATNAVVQMKKRIEMLNPNLEAKTRRIASRIEEAKDIRKKSKDALYDKWKNEIKELESRKQVLSESDFNQYISEIHKNFTAKLSEIRSYYSDDINNIILDENLESSPTAGISVKSGLDYFGELDEKTGIRKQKDTGKQYVPDASGKYVPRYALRYLSGDEQPEKGLETKHYDESAMETTLRQRDDIKGHQTWKPAIRSFFQNRYGGGYRTSMISATTSTRPIRGNKGGIFTHDSGGAVIIDNTRLNGREGFLAQYDTMGEFHKKATDMEYPTTTGDQEAHRQKMEPQLEEARLSGLRNKETHYTEIPRNAIMSFMPNEGGKSEAENEDAILKRFKEFREQSKV